MGARGYRRGLPRLGSVTNFAVAVLTNPTLIAIDFGWRNAQGIASMESRRREISPRVQWRPRSDADHASHGPQFSSAVRRYWPVPLSATVLLPAATLSVTVSVPVRAPFTVGAKVTEIVQPNVAASCWGQLLICENSPEFAPVMAMLLMINGVSPVLVSCTGKVVLLPTALVPKASCVWSN